MPFKEDQHIAIEYSTPQAGAQMEVGLFKGSNEFGIIYEHQPSKTLTLVNLRSSSVILVRELTEEEITQYWKGDSH